MSTEQTKMQWVEEIPARTRIGSPGGGKYQALVHMLAEHPGRIAKLGPMGRTAASGAVARLRKLGSDATSRSIDGEVYVFVSLDGESKEED